MKILLAAPSRDLLQSYQKLLSEDFGETVSVFDGTQLLRLLAEGDYSLAILDRSLPRVRHELLLRQLRQENVPVITLLPETLSVRHLTEEPLANFFLPYPFQPETICRLIRDLIEKRQSGEVLPFANTALETAAFRLRGGCALTGAEIDVLTRLLTRGPVSPENSGVLVSALNHKFQKNAVRARIQYATGKGFQLVTDNE